MLTPAFEIHRLRSQFARRNYQPLNRRRPNFAACLTTGMAIGVVLALLIFACGL